MELDRLDSVAEFAATGGFPIFKIFPALDISYHNRQHVCDRIWHNRSFYKILLVRRDIRQQLLSHCISLATDTWSVTDQQWIAQHETQTTLSTDTVQQHIQRLKLWWTWVWLNQDKYHKIAWYHQLDTEHYPDLGFAQSDLRHHSSTRMNVDHVQNGRKVLANFDAIAALCESAAADICPMVDLFALQGRALYDRPQTTQKLSICDSWR
jgi:hypothetical protein